ncbi:Fic/DOC family protein [Wenxinia saemankumensis]|uniref:Fic/DOC family protein n=2 Tax=Wenxinia saemankumensis TaxID=1447782 RepID=A0A1M6HQZ4_9RHOB|nr:Fic/DOC family protein [Wenxinia saemankumensis]
MIIGALDRPPFRLRPSAIQELNRCAIEGLDAFAGNWRPAGIGIGESDHEPPGAHLVAELIEELCDYVNDGWDRLSAVHLSSMVMWRMNWIHPFTDGNGRTSRAASYLVLSVHAGALLPGRETIPEQITSNRKPYYDALEAADKLYKEQKQLGPTLVSDMEKLIGAMFAQQLRGALDDATIGPAAS